MPVSSLSAKPTFGGPRNTEPDDMPAPLDLETFLNYGSSTTPTLVIIDKVGVVRSYHPGVMKEEELRAVLDKVAR